MQTQRGKYKEAGRGQLAGDHQGQVRGEKDMDQGRDMERNREL